MYIIRRRSDGAYSKGLRSNSGYSREQWTANLQEVLPYRNKTSALTTAGYYTGGSSFLYARMDRKTWKPRADLLECCKAIDCSWRGTKKVCEHYKAAMAEGKAKWEAQYELLEVRLELVQ